MTIVLACSIAIALLALAAPHLDRNSKLLRVITAFIGLPWGLRYIHWRVTSPVPAGPWLPLELFAYALIVLEVVLTIIGFYGYGFDFKFRDIRDRRKEADRQSDWYANSPPSVGILVPTYNEPWHVLERTLVGALDQDYPNFRIWLLDDGRRAWLAAKARDWNVGYVSRDSSQHFKAGNINNALRELRARGELPEFIALLDADFVPRPEFLRRTVALAKQPTVGIVQTPQYYYNAEPFQRVFGIRNWPEDSRLFYDIEQPAGDANGFVLCCGTACLLRTAAVEAIGGIPTDSVTEDTLSSLRMSKAGWQTVYLNERLAVGLAAEDLASWLKQRHRWLAGSLQNWRLQLLENGRFPRRLWPMAKYWFGLLRLTIEAVRDLMWIFAQAIFWFTGYWILSDSPAVAASYFVPLWLLFLMWGRLSGGRLNPIVTTAPSALLRPARLRIPIQIALGTWRAHFDVTAKAPDQRVVRVHWRVIAAHAPAALLLLAGIVFTLLSPAAPARGHAWLWPNLALSAYMIAEIIAALAPAVERPQRRVDDRYETDETISVSSAGGVFEARCRNISVGGALVELPRSVPPPRRATLTIPDVGATEVQLVRSDSDRLAAYAFQGAEQRVLLIRKIYCSGRYIPFPERWSLSRALAAIARWLFVPRFLEDLFARRDRLRRSERGPASTWLLR